MEKKLLLLGIVLVILGFVIAGSSYNPGSYVNTYTDAVAIAPNSTISAPLFLNITSFFSITFLSANVPIDFYIMNSSAFAYAQPYLNSSPIPGNVAAHLEGRGLLFEALNSTASIYPYNSSYSSLGIGQPYYSFGAGNALPAGEYYMIYSNPSNTYSNTTYRYDLPNASVLNPKSTFYSALGSTSIASSALVIVGIILAVLSFFRNPKPKEDPKAREAEIARLYSQIDKKEKKHKAARRAPRRAARKKGSSGKAKASKSRKRARRRR